MTGWRHWCSSRLLPLHAEQHRLHVTDQPEVSWSNYVIQRCRAPRTSMLAGLENSCTQCSCAGWWAGFTVRCMLVPAPSLTCGTVLPASAVADDDLLPAASWAESALQVQFTCLELHAMRLEVQGRIRLCWQLFLCCRTGRLAATAASIEGIARLDSVQMSHLAAATVTATCPWA
jgi:hypothetical protein